MDPDPELTPARAARLAAREGRLGSTRGVALGYLQCNLVILRRPLAYHFLLYCQRNQKACPVLEVTDDGDPEPRSLAPGADLRTDLPRYSVYRNGKHTEDREEILDLWEKDSVAFLIGSGITFDEALQRAGVPTDKHRWVLTTNIPTQPAGPFHGNLVVTMRWLTPAQAIIATQVSARFPFNHGAPVHIGDPGAIGANLDQPLFGDPVNGIPGHLVPVFWACGVTPQAVAEASGVDFMITHAPAHGFVSDLHANDVCLP
ncbi:MAG: DUF1445 domain-containing protein [Akkermansiaceae bacterium]|nr:DUF1445 domain-containing protein [Akkermansiaceae bacterium]